MIVVQIGTNTASWEHEGNTHWDPCLKFIKENQSDIEFVHLIEPLNSCIPHIEKSYEFFPRKKIHNIAITDSPTQKEIIIHFPKLHTTSGHASSNFQHLLAHGHKEIESCNVPCFTLNNFFELNSITTCDKLFIDTEGLDCLILLGYDYNKYKTNFIEFEIVHSDGSFTQSTIADRCLSKLKSDGFSITNSSDDSLNLIAYR